jgi:hypothetical protein
MAVYSSCSEELDKEFYKEFKQMMNERKSLMGAFNLQNLMIPEDMEMVIPNAESILIRRIPEDIEYYSKLNNTECLRIGRVALKRRMFNSKGEFKTNEDGSFQYEEVPVPRTSIAVFSNVKINVPYSYKKDGFGYVDYIDRSTKGKTVRSFMYIIPKNYCYKLNKVALEASLNRQRQSYEGYRVALQNGQYIYLQVTPFKFTDKRNAGEKFLVVKNSTNFSEELTHLLEFWIENNIIFNPQLCQLEGCQVGNCAVETLAVNLDFYEMFDREHSLADAKEMNVDDFVGFEA